MSTARLSQVLVESTGVKPHALEREFLFFEVVKFLSLHDGRLSLGRVRHSLRKMEVRAPFGDGEKELIKAKLGFYSEKLTKSIFLKGDTILKPDSIDLGCGLGGRVVFTEPLAHFRYNYTTENEEIALERIKQMATYMVNHPNSYHCQNQIMVAFSSPVRKACVVGGIIGGMVGAGSCWFTSWCFPSFAASLIGPAGGVGAAVGSGSGCLSSCYSISQIGHYKHRHSVDEREQLGNEDARTFIATKILENFRVLKSIHNRLSFIALMSNKNPSCAESKDEELHLSYVPGTKNGC